MKIWIVLLFLIIPTLSHALSKVEFEWEEVEGAKVYHVELKNNHSFFKKLHSSTSTFITEMSPGRYQIRGKVSGLDPNDPQSDWSPWKAFDIAPAAVKLSATPPKENKILSNSYLSEIPLKWSDVDGAAEYLIEVLDEQGKVVKTQQSTKPEVALKLRPGYYAVRIRAKTPDGLESEPTELPERLMVQNIPVPAPKNVAFDATKNTLNFEASTGTLTEVVLESQKFFSENWYQVERTSLEGDIYVIKSKLKPGKYRLTVYSKNSFGEVSTPTIKEFVRKPTEAELPL